MKKLLIVGFAVLALLAAAPVMGHANIEMTEIDGVYHVEVTCSSGLTGSGTFLSPSAAVDAAMSYCAEQ